jgi:hypothetical protein
MTVREAALVLGVSMREVHERLTHDGLRSRLVGRTFQVDVPLSEEPSVCPLHVENVLRHKAASPRLPQPPVAPPVQLLSPVRTAREAHAPRPLPVAIEKRSTSAAFGWLLLSLLLTALIGVGVAQWMLSALNRWELR